MKSLFKKLPTSFYTIPFTYVITFSVLSIFLNLMDRADFYGNSNLFFINSFDYGHDLFLLMIGSLITLITISISLMMVVLTVYGAQFSPRTLQDFLLDRKTLHILGVLIGILIYSIFSFYLINQLDRSLQLISPLFGTLFFAISIFVFVYFIRFVSRSVQINIYIQKLGQEITERVKEKESLILSDEFVHYKKDVVLKDKLALEPFYVTTKNSGYVHNYDISKIIELAMKHNFIVLSKVRIGEYVFEEDVLFELYNLKEQNEEIINQLQELVVLNEESSLQNSLGFGTRKLTEIALRAMSQSTNDTATACFCIEQLGDSLKVITTILAHVVYTDKDQKIYLIAEKDDFSRILYDHFSQMKLYGFTDFTIVKSVLSAFTKIAKRAEDKQNNELWEFVKFMLSDIDFQHLQKYEYEFVISDLYQIAYLTNNKNEFQKLYKKT